MQDEITKFYLKTVFLLQGPIKPMNLTSMLMNYQFKLIGTAEMKELWNYRNVK